MSARRKRSFMDDIRKSEELSKRWRALCARHLPVGSDGTIWRYSRAGMPGDPSQGWKLHVSATSLNAPAVLERIAPTLTKLGVRFKAPSSLHELRVLNSGLTYGYSQVGKVFTVYPRTPEEAARLARRLHRLTRHLPAPIVPFDRQFRPGSNVFYRYGGFDSFEMELPDGRRVPALRAPDGNPIPDLRECAKAKPDWVEDLFPRRQSGRRNVRPLDTPLQTTFHVFRALSQRGRGGVYQAVDLSAHAPRLCLLKEGRRNGEVTWDGRDGRWRVMHEEHVLTALRARGVESPRVYASFELDGNYYLATEFIEGETLNAFLAGRERRLPVVRVLLFAVEVARLLGKIQDAGWVWRDCKPSNLMLTKRGGMRPLDFEGACPVGRPDPLPWVTPAFSRPGSRAAAQTTSGVEDDLYALGAVIYLMLTGVTPGAPPAFTPAGRLRRNTPPELCALVSELLNPAPRRRADLQAVERRLRATLSRVRMERASCGRGRSESQPGGKGRLSRRARSANLASERRPSKAASTVR